MDLLLHDLGGFAAGMRTTAAISLLSFAGAMAIGLAVAACRISPVPPLRAAGAVYVEGVRNVPLLVLLFLFFFGLPKVGLRYPPFPSAAIVLSIYTGTFLGEAIRSGVNTVSRGQVEAARAIGLTFPQTLRLVVLPQAFRSVVAPIGNLFIALVKNSSLTSTVAVVELSFFADQRIAQTAQPFPFFVGTAIAYLLLTLPAGWLFGVVERRVAIRR